MQRANVLAVQVHGHVVLKGDDRQRGFGRGLHVKFHRAAIAAGAAGFEPLRTLSWAMSVEPALLNGTFRRCGLRDSAC